MSDMDAWWRLVRRACGIPDIVSDENVLRYAIARSIIGNAAPSRDEAATTWQVAQAVVERGARGELDEFLVGVSNASTTANLVAPPAAPQMAGLVDWQNDQARKLLERVGAYVADHPFAGDPAAGV